MDMTTGLTLPEQAEVCVVISAYTGRKYVLPKIMAPSTFSQSQYFCVNGSCQRQS